MKTTLLFFAIILTISFNSNGQQVSLGDTVEFTGDYKNEYIMEKIDGDRFKAKNGVKYLVINKIKNSSMFYIASAKIVETVETVEPIITVKKDPIESMTFTMYQSGQLLVQAGSLKNGAIAVQIIGGIAGVGLAVFGGNNTSLIAGYSIIGAAQLTGFVMNIIGNQRIKQAGEMFKKEKLKL